jgi:hypothetical protein
VLPSSFRKEMQIQCKCFMLYHVPVVLLWCARDNGFLSSVYTNRDGYTGFGTPWEIRFQSNYTILRKGGNVGGYSALFSFVPELQLSKQR